MKIKKNVNSISENQLVKRLKNLINEAPPMSFGPEVGGARPSGSLKGKIERGELPLSKFGLTQPQVDFFTSEAFKDSIVSLEKLLDDYSGIDRRLTTANQSLKTDSQTAFMRLYSLVSELLGELVNLQSKNVDELEEIATESVEKAMGIDREFFSKKLKLDGKFTKGFLGKLKGMKNKIDKISDKEILEKFSNIDEEKKAQLEQMKQEFESDGVEFDEDKAKEAIESNFKISPETIEKANKEFSDEVSRRMIVNMFRRGMALYYSNAYEICKDQIMELPDGERIIQLSNVIQPIMEHLYWLFPDIGSVGSSGGGQIGQIEVVPPKGNQGNQGGGNDDDGEDDEDETPQQRQQQETPKPSASGPFTIRARAMTLPLLVHELVKGVVMFFTSAGGENSEKGKLAKQQASSLEIEAYDLVYSEKFYKEFYKVFNEIVPDVQEQRDLTPFMLKFLSEERYETLVELAKSLFTLGLENPEYAENYITGLVNKSKKLAKKMEQNPTYTQKKKYGREKDDSEFDDFLNDLGF
jgi:hypothetical protein